MSSRILATYSETCNLIRHYDTLKYTCWTVFTAIIAGLYVAKSSNEVSGGIFVILVGLSSLYFCFLLTRIQRNYKIYCRIAEQLEDLLRKDEQAERGHCLPEDFKIGPFDMANAVLPGNFNKVTRFEAMFGAIPYFMLHILFFVGVFATFFAIYLVSPSSDSRGSEPKAASAAPRVEKAASAPSIPATKATPTPPR